MLHDLLKFRFKLMILFHITFICTLYDIVLPNKYLYLYLFLEYNLNTSLFYGIIFSLSTYWDKEEETTLGTRNSSSFWRAFVL